MGSAQGNDRGRRDTGADCAQGSVRGVRRAGFDHEVHRQEPVFL